MKIILVSVLSGVIGAFLTANLITGLHAQNDTETLAQAINRGDCQVSIGTPFIQGGFRCSRGRVMTGLWDGSLYCSDLRVTCLQ
jgi:hypothetical protein